MKIYLKNVSPLPVLFLPPFDVKRAEKIRVNKILLLEKMSLQSCEIDLRNLLFVRNSHVLISMKICYFWLDQKISTSFCPYVGAIWPISYGILERQGLGIFKPEKSQRMLIFLGQAIFSNARISVRYFYLRDQVFENQRILTPWISNFRNS